MKDEAIVSLIYEKDELGLLKLADKYEKLLIHIAAGILGSRSRDIEECVNDTYLKLWNHIERYDMDKASLKTYLKVIVRNTAINKLRDLSKREERELPEDISDIAKYYIDQSQSVEGQIFSKESMKHLNKVISGLSERDKELVIRKYFYLQSSKEIAKATKMTVTAIDSRISRLRNKMKQEFLKEKEACYCMQKGVIYE
ncbi:MAG: polymerase, sigma-24 subunit, subfamily [Lachnospiraceae bacterium]|nr:polymerase, sigma-24 subunit, subfamily [Anaerocolumna sp.]MDF2609419.1 polymerase, sigma-24 subunit, subfamily [Lachnospiraceae bacterium]